MKSLSITFEDLIWGSNIGANFDILEGFIANHPIRDESR